MTHGQAGTRYQTSASWIPIEAMRKPSGDCAARDHVTEPHLPDFGAFSQSGGWVIGGKRRDVGHHRLFG